MTPLQRAVLGYRRRAPSSKHAQLWQAMRILRRFTLLDLMATCEQDNKRTVSTYVSQLRSAGYIKTLRGVRHQLAQHQLVRDTGPRCPAIVGRGSVVYDLNTDTEYPIR